MCYNKRRLTRHRITSITYAIRSLYTYITIKITNIIIIKYNQYRIIQFININKILDLYREREIEERLRKQEEEARRATEEKERWGRRVSIKIVINIKYSFSFTRNILLSDKILRYRMIIPVTVVADQRPDAVRIN